MWKVKMTAPFFTGCIFFRRSGPGGGRFAGACRRGYFLGQSQSRAPSPAKRVSSSFLLAFGGEKSPIGDSQYGSPPGRSFYSCKRNQNTLGALPQDPCRWLCWIRIDFRREPKINPYCAQNRSQGSRSASALSPHPLSRGGKGARMGGRLETEGNALGVLGLAKTASRWP